MVTLFFLKKEEEECVASRSYYGRVKSRISCLYYKARQSAFIVSHQRPPLTKCPRLKPIFKPETRRSEWALVVVLLSALQWMYIRRYICYTQYSQVCCTQLLNIYTCKWQKSFFMGKCKRFTMLLHSADQQLPPHKMSRHTVAMNYDQNYGEKQTRWRFLEKWIQDHCLYAYGDAVSSKYSESLLKIYCP